MFSHPLGRCGAPGTNLTAGNTPGSAEALRGKFAETALIRRQAITAQRTASLPEKRCAALVGWWRRRGARKVIAKGWSDWPITVLQMGVRVAKVNSEITKSNMSHAMKDEDGSADTVQQLAGLASLAKLRTITAVFEKYEAQILTLQGELSEGFY